MPVKKQSSTTIRIDLLPEIHEKPTRKRIVSITAPANASRGKKTEADVARPRPLWGADFQELFQSVYDGALITQADGKIIDANDRALRFSGYTREEVRDLNILNLISCADESLLDIIAETLREEKFVDGKRVDLVRLGLLKPEFVSALGDR